MNATQTQVSAALKQAGWRKDRIADAACKEFEHKAGSTTATISFRYSQPSDAVLLTAVYHSEGRNILATLQSAISLDRQPEEVADAVRNYINTVTREIAKSYAMRLHVMPGWWLSQGTTGAMLVCVLAHRPDPDSLVYVHPSSRTPIPCTVETFRSWAAEYMGEALPIETAAEIDKAWDRQHSTNPASPRLFRHIKSGGIYEFVSEGKLELNQEPVVIYRKADNPDEVWVRPHGEFFDGRFEELGS